MMLIEIFEMDFYVFMHVWILWCVIWSCVTWDGIYVRWLNLCVQYMLMNLSWTKRKMMWKYEELWNYKMEKYVVCEVLVWLNVDCVHTVVILFWNYENDGVPLWILWYVLNCVRRSGVLCENNKHEVKGKVIKGS